MLSFLVDFGTWLQGMLFVLIAYHISSYVFTKDRSFVLYAIYLFLVLVYLIAKTENVTSLEVTNKYAGFFSTINWFIQIWYWIFYIWFSLHFLSIKQKTPKFYEHARKSLWVSGIISVLFFIVDVIFFKSAYIGTYFSFVFIPTSLVFLSSFLYVIYKFKDPINTFYLIGLLFFVGFSFIALYFSITMLEKEEGYIQPIDYFKIGVFLEAIILSIGLGYKYHIYRKERNDFNLQLIDEFKKNELLKDLLNQQLSEQVEETTLELQSVAKQAEHYKIEQLEAKYKSQIDELRLTSLLSQMNPHFIFNALNSIKLYIINSDKKKAAHYLNKFSKLIRKILEASRSKEVRLAEELETMDLYMTIENIRFSNEIDFQIHVSKSINLETIRIPPLVLQPFLENAIWHGLSSKKDEKRVWISIEKLSNDYLQISIEDNGIGREAAEKIKKEKTIQRESIGIDLTKKRLDNYAKNFQNKYSLTYVDLKDPEKNATGTKVVLQIPLF